MLGEVTVYAVKLPLSLVLLQRLIGSLADLIDGYHWGRGKIDVRKRV